MNSEQKDYIIDWIEKYQHNIPIDEFKERILRVIDDAAGLRKVSGQGIYRPGKYVAAIDKQPTKEYRLWIGMLSRCAENGPIQKNQPAYIGCSVNQGFVHFQDFAEWCNNQIGFGLPGWQLDKDILVPGNKVYGPDTCCFVPSAINSLMVKPQKSELPTGITFYKPTGKYVASISLFGARKYLGCSDSIESLVPVYLAEKSRYLIQVANQWKDRLDLRVYDALIVYADMLVKGSV